MLMFIITPKSRNCNISHKLISKRNYVTAYKNIYILYAGTYKKTPPDIPVRRHSAFFIHYFSSGILHHNHLDGVTHMLAGIRAAFHAVINFSPENDIQHIAAVFTHTQGCFQIKLVADFFHMA